MKHQLFCPACLLFGSAHESSCEKFDSLLQSNTIKMFGKSFPKTGWKGLTFLHRYYLFIYSALPRLQFTVMLFEHS